MWMRSISGLSIACLAASGAIAAAPPRDIVIDGTAVFPENIAASRDGAVFFGSVTTGAIYRAAPGERVARPWIAGGTAGMRQSLGLFAEDRAGLLWVCAPGARAKDGQPAEPTAIKTFDLKTGAPRASYAFEGGGRCNDLTVARDGTVYAGDFDGGRVMRLDRRAAIFRAWSSDARFASVDGMAMLDGKALYVNTYRTGLLFRIPLERVGTAGAPVAISTDRPLGKPDGMRAAGGKLLLAEGEGRFTEIAIAGDTATARTLKDGLTDSPTGVALVGTTAFVVQTKWAAMKAADPGPFSAIAIPYPVK